MDGNDILKATETSKRLIQDENYYKYIFKKTERIVSVVFYILHNVPQSSQTSLHIEDIQHAARSVHDAVLQSLESRVYAAEDIIRSVAHSLISLESKLSVAQVSGMLAPEVLTVLHGEIDAVIRGLNRYMGEDNDLPAFAVTDTEVHREPRKLHKPRKETTHQQPVSSPLQPDRRARIQTILEAKGEASIKDISDIISDVSEKTIQRELNAMIEDNIIKRQGERRWSRYSIF